MNFLDQIEADSKDKEILFKDTENYLLKRKNKIQKVKDYRESKARKL